MIDFRLRSLPNRFSNWPERLKNYIPASRLISNPREQVRAPVDHVTWFSETLLRLHHRFVQSTFIELEDHPPFTEIPNFTFLKNASDGSWSPAVYRGGQPTARGYQWLREAGFDTIINLRGEVDHGGQVDRWGWFKQHHFPIPDRETPSFKQVEHALEIIDHRQNAKVYLHCRGGTGRAPMIGACWQIKHGLSAEQAIREVIRRGEKMTFGRNLFHFSRSFTLNFFFNTSITIGQGITITFSINSKQQKFLTNFEQYWLERRKMTGGAAMPA